MIQQPLSTTLFPPPGGNVFDQENGYGDPLFVSCWLVSGLDAVPHRGRRCGLTLAHDAAGVGTSHIEVAHFQVVRCCFGRRNVDAKEHCTLVLLHEVSNFGGIALRGRCASADREQFEIAVVLEADDGIGETSGEMAALANCEPKLFVVVLGLGEVTNSNADVIDAPPCPRSVWVGVWTLFALG